ncbi:hypothetical protein C8Q74DRAFT_1274078 [Fomes fomentarius]|nr:hypothetical protein C8Q74DRAFT_1274078 [Fomes fomentarius]
MDYKNPPRHLRNAYYDAGKWSDPDQLDNFRGDFLRMHDHHPHATDRYGSRRLTDDRLSIEAISLGGRRASQSYGDEHSPAAKRPRIVIARAAVEAPRRSERKRKDPSDAPPASPPARELGRKEVARSPPRTQTQVTRVARPKKCYFRRHRLSTGGPIVSCYTHSPSTFVIAMLTFLSLFRSRPSFVLQCCPSAHCCLSY